MLIAAASKLLPQEIAKYFHLPPKLPVFRSVWRLGLGEPATALIKIISTPLDFAAFVPPSGSH